MRVSDEFEQRRLLSFEVFPPKGELKMDEARRVLSGMTDVEPDFVSVTYSAGGVGDSSATAEIVQMGQDDLGLTMVAHQTCAGMTREALDRRVAHMRELGVENVLALRGDAAPAAGGDFALARDIIPVLREAGFCVGAAAYPEGHIDCDDDYANVRYLREKQDAGAQFFVTQLFFDNELAYRFLDRARSAGVEAPITFGVMPILSKSQVTRMVFMCGASLPARLVKLLARWENDPDSLRKAGLEYACDQLEDLARNGVDGVHVYSMNHPEIARAAAHAVRPYLDEPVSPSRAGQRWRKPAAGAAEPAGTAGAKAVPQAAADGATATTGAEGVADAH